MNKLHPEGIFQGGIGIRCKCFSVQSVLLRGCSDDKVPVKIQCFFMLTQAHTYNNLRKKEQEREWGNGRIDGLMFDHRTAMKRKHFRGREEENDEEQRSDCLFLLHTVWSVSVGSTIVFSMVFITSFHSSFSTLFRTVFSQILANSDKLKPKTENISADRDKGNNHLFSTNDLFQKMFKCF